MKIWFYGCGQMGGAILDGLLKNKSFDANEIGVFDTYAPTLEKWSKVGVQVVDPSAIGSNPLIVVLSIKPQVFKTLKGQLQKEIPKGSTVISIMAGVSLAEMKDCLGADVQIVRTMPNLPLAFGAGATAIAVDGVKVETLKEVRSVFEPVGQVVEVKEAQMDAVTAVSGSGPAWVFEFVEAWIRGGVHEGLSRQESEKLVIQTLRGSLEMLEQSGQSPCDLTARVCSPGGTTIAGVKALQEKGFSAAVGAAVCAASQRSKELK